MSWHGLERDVVRWGGVSCHGMGCEMSWNGLKRDVMRWGGVSCHGRGCDEEMGLGEMSREGV